MAATLPTAEEVRAIVHQEVDALRRDLAAALAQLRGEQLMTPAEAAKETGIALRTIQRWIQVGALPSFGRGRVRRFRRADLDKVLGKVD